MKKILGLNHSCPFCGADIDNIVQYVGKESIKYRCICCECVFTKKDIEHELLRQQVSGICSALHATEENPINCSIDDAMELHIDLYEVSQGLRESEKPQVLSIFHDSEGIVWIDTDYDGIIELDGILTDSIREILDWLKENYKVN